MTEKTEEKLLKEIGKRFYINDKFYCWNDGCNRYWCLYNNEELGYIEYYSPWSKFVWNQNKDIIMSKGCLNSVIKLIKIIEQLKKEIGDLQ